MSKETIYKEDAIKALRIEYPMMPLFKSLREEWAIKTEGYRKAEEVIMKLPSVDTPTTATGVIDAIREAEYRGCMKTVEERPKGEWASALAELHERFDALEKEIRKASAEMSAIIREHVDRKTEPTISKMEQVEDEPQTEPLQTCSVSGRPYSECADCEHFKCTADEPQTVTGKDLEEVGKAVARAKAFKPNDIDEPLTKCDLCKREGDDICLDCERKKQSGKE